MSASYEFGILPIPGSAIYLLAAWALLCIWLTLKQRFTGLAIAMVMAGVLQWPFIALVGNLTLQLTTDVAALALLASAAWHLRKRLVSAAMLTTLLGVCAFLAVQVLRAPDVQSGAFALRQIVYPLFLAVAGFLLADVLNWRRLGLVLSALTVGVSAYMLAEKLYGGPILDPTPSEIALAGGSSAGLRLGLPFAYVSDGIGGAPYIRPGGPFFNPPIAGIFLGTGVYALLRWVRPRLALPLVLLATLACGMAVARAGLLMIAFVVLVPLSFRYIGRRSSLLVGVTLGLLAGVKLSEQGATAAHSTGLVRGISFALRNPLGSGIGTQGYFGQPAGAASLAVSESWLGVVVASTGLLTLVGLVVVLWLCVSRAWQKSHRAVARDILPLGVLAVAALTESASSMRGASAMWLLMGEALATRVAVRWPGVGKADVLFVVRDAAFVGGSERVSLDLANRLAEDLEVRTLSLESRKGTLLPARVTSLRTGTPYPELDLVAPLRILPLEDGLLTAVRRRIERRALARRLNAAIQASDEAVVVINHNAVLPRWVRSADLVRVVVHMHASTTQFRQELNPKARTPIRLKGWLSSRARRRESVALLAVMRTCREVVVTNPGEAEDLAEFLGRPVRVIGNPLPWDLPRGPVASETLRRDLLFVGRLAAEKRPSLVLEVFGELRARGHEVDLLMLGDGPERDLLEARSRALGLDPAVVLPGVQNVVAATYASGGVLLLTSQFEAFPMVLVEAASQGMPCVATDVSPGVRWLAERTHGVRVVSAPDAKALADAVEFWWRETPMQAQGRRQRTTEGLQVLTQERVASRWLALIEDIRGPRDAQAAPAPPGVVHA